MDKLEGSENLGLETEMGEGEEWVNEEDCALYSREFRNRERKAERGRAGTRSSGPEELPAGRPERPELSFSPPDVTPVPPLPRLQLCIVLSFLISSKDPRTTLRAAITL